MWCSFSLDGVCWNLKCYKANWRWQSQWKRESHLKIMMLLGGQLKKGFWMEVVNEGLLFKMIIFETKYFSSPLNLSLLRWFVEKLLTIYHASSTLNLLWIKMDFFSSFIIQNSTKWVDDVYLTSFRFWQFTPIFLGRNDYLARCSLRSRKKTIFWDLPDDWNEESGIQHSLTVVATLIEFLSEFKTTSNGFLLPKKNELLRVEFN